MCNWSTWTFRGYLQLRQQSTFFLSFYWEIVSTIIKKNDLQVTENSRVLKTINI